MLTDPRLRGPRAGRSRCGEWLDAPGRRPAGLGCRGVSWVRARGNAHLTLRFLGPLDAAAAGAPEAAAAGAPRRACPRGTCRVARPRRVPERGRRGCSGWASTLPAADAGAAGGVRARGAWPRGSTPRRAPSAPHLTLGRWRDRGRRGPSCRRATWAPRAPCGPGPLPERPPARGAPLHAPPRPSRWGTAGSSEPGVLVRIRMTAPRAGRVLPPGLDPVQLPRGPPRAASTCARSAAATWARRT